MRYLVGFSICSHLAILYHVLELLADIFLEYLLVFLLSKCAFRG